MDGSPGLRLSKEEYARRGDEIYERDMLPGVAGQDQGKFVVIDTETGDYEVDTDEVAATDRLRERRPATQVWLRRIVSRYARRFGWRRTAASAGLPARSMFGAKRSSHWWFSVPTVGSTRSRP